MRHLVLTLLAALSISACTQTVTNEVVSQVSEEPHATSEPDSPVVGSSREFQATPSATAYQLHQPTAAEYLAAIPEVVERANGDFGLTLMLQRAIDLEVGYRFSALGEQDFASLINGYNALYPLSTWLDRDAWNQSILTAWLRENSVDLRTLGALRSDLYTINVTHLDFNNDGVDELILNVQLSDGSYRKLLLMQRDRDGYRFVETPIPWFADGSPYWSTQSGALKQLRLEDINADGLPEWVLALGGLGGGFETHGRLYILSWRDKHLVDLMPDRAWYSGPTGWWGTAVPDFINWNIDNLDGDEAMEVEQIQRYDDNWGCTFYETRTFDWDNASDTYNETGSEVRFDSSANCLLRDAQEAMWEDDLAHAIPLFAQSLALFQADDDPAAADRMQYTQVRLALAYSLAGRDDEAAATLANLHADGTQSGLIHELVLGAQQVYQDGYTPLGLCSVAYNTFHSANPSEAAAWGETMDIVKTIDPYEAELSSNRTLASCDASTLIDEVLTTHSLSTLTSPLEQLAAVGLDADYEINADLNGDGQDEWLIWPIALVDPIFLAANPGEPTYHVSRPDVRRPDQFNQVFTQQLPGQAGTAIGNLVYIDTYLDYEFYSYNIPRKRCPEPREHSGGGVLNLWRLDGLELHPAADAFLCGPFTLSEIFPAGEGSVDLYAWASTPLDGQPAATMIYEWDDTLLMYAPPSAAEPTAEPPPPSDTYENLQSTLDMSFYTFNFEGDPQGALDLLDEALANYDPDEDIQVVMAAHYWRGFLLETLDQEEQALAEYGIIHDEALKSAWGILATLHLQPITGE